MPIAALTNRCKYGILALLELASAEENELMTIAQIADRQNIPARFLEAILRQLKREGIVESVRGNSGGYLLTEKPSLIVLGRVVDCLEERRGQAAELKAECSSHEKVIAAVFSDAFESFFKVLDSTSLQDVLDDLQTKTGTINYVI